MKTVFILFLFTGALFILNCSPAKQFTGGRPRVVVKEDTSTIIQYIETDFEARQKSDLNQMLGNWEVVNMRRQQKAELETLSNVYFELKPDLTFAGKGGCNNMSGKFSVKGSSVKFNSIISTKMACNNIDKENTFFNLLENRVSEYTYNGDQLLLRDGSSNIVFECKRK
ncbi:MAG TPA: META domain-containing protein [Chitinophagaceae bacterium]|jgi:heat shock protein HslJ|nr:META domain-containing protein [Chitinophagaceae bacterium]